MRGREGAQQESLQIAQVLQLFGAGGDDAVAVPGGGDGQVIFVIDMAESNNIN